MQLEERLRRLERRCRWLSALALLSPVAVGVGALAGANRAADEKVVRARGLEIVDDAGRVRIHLGPEDEGYGVVVNDAEGSFRATLTDAPGGAAIQLRKKGGQIKLMATEPIPGAIPGGAEITVSDGTGQIRVIAAVDERGVPALRMLDEKGKPQFSAPK